MSVKNPYRVAVDMNYPVLCSSQDVLKYCTGFKKMEGETTNLFYGIELEVGGRIYTDKAENARAVIGDMGDNAILKEEGCVMHKGFEIVTVPATLRYHKEKLWEKFFKNSVKCMSSRSHGWGLHIHFSRNALSNAHLAKVIYFLHEPINASLLVLMAGRNLDFGRRQVKKDYYMDGVEGIIRKATHTRDAISVSHRTNGNTCEVRIFKSQTSKKLLFKALEFLDALIQYCGQCGDSVGVLQAKPFLEWFMHNNKGTEYPYLRQFLARRGYVPAKTFAQQALDLLKNLQAAKLKKAG